MVEIRTRWIDDLDVMGYDEQGHSVLMSNSEYLGKVKKGIAPMEAFLYALAGCTSMDVVSIMKKKKVNFKTLETVVRAERAEEHPKYYTKIELEYIVKGWDIDPQAVERSVELSQNKYCPVSAMIRMANIPLSYKITIIDYNKEEGEE